MMDWLKPPEPGEKPTPVSYIVLAIWAMIILGWMQSAIEADPVRCNALIVKPGPPGSLFRSILTCQKLYHYQPDPFTG